MTNDEFRQEFPALRDMADRHLDMVREAVMRGTAVRRGGDRCVCKIDDSGWGAVRFNRGRSKMVFRSFPFEALEMTPTEWADEQQQRIKA